MNLLGEKITYCREEIYHLSKKDFAKMIDVSPNSLSKYEKGISTPSIDTLYLLTLITDMPMEAFANEDFKLEDFIKLSKKIVLGMLLGCNFNALDEIYQRSYGLE